MIQSLALSEDMSNFMHLLNHKGRLEYIKKIQEQYRLLADQASGLVRAQVFSARPLAPDMQTRLILALEKRTLKKVEAEFAVSPELIGGLKVQIGGMLLDGSVAEQLRRMEESLKRI
jgi:F-type H+-transporting ATPase subunit delta